MLALFRRLVRGLKPGGVRALDFEKKWAEAVREKHEMMAERDRAIDRLEVLKSKRYERHSRVVSIVPFSIGEWLAHLECGHTAIVFAEEHSETPKLTAVICAECSGLVHPKWPV